MTPAKPCDFAVIGGGIVGLSIAWELSGYGTVTLIERGLVGREASWAGAGILVPSSIFKAVHPGEILAAESFRLHTTWAKRLREETGIDTGYRKCGALLIARTPGEVASLTGQCLEWSENDVSVESLTREEILRRVPILQSTIDQIKTAAMLPDESQLRNPHHLRALKAACEQRGVRILEQQGESGLVTEEDALAKIVTEAGQQVVAHRYCMAAGAWTQELVKPIGVSISTLPVRGQMLLFKLPRKIFEPILYEGTRYIVPRDDGHVVVGSTLEEAGFDKTTTPEGINGLMEFASQLVPELNQSSLSNFWAGLRPASFDGFPYIGRIPHLKNAWIATGHFRSGLLLSPGTAVLVRQLMCDQEPLLDHSPFRVDRG